MERTLNIIKPDAVSRNLVGKILTCFEEHDLKIRELKKLRLCKKEAESFYEVHQGKPFYESLTTYMATGPIVVSVLEGEDAINRVRSIMGATDPSKAEQGTIRAQYGLNVEKNSVHGSDAPETAAAEITFFFNALEL